VRGPSPGSLPQIAFAGRSNVGKSSLINLVLGRTRTAIARVSATPGKTQEINFYKVRAELDDAETQFFLVDLPGYGYARAPADQRRRWKPLMEWYLGETKELRGVVQLVDIRHGPTKDDLQMVDYLAHANVPALFVLTKADKIKPAQLRSRVREIADKLGVEDDQVLAVSTLQKLGQGELLESLGALLGTDENREAEGTELKYESILLVTAVIAACASAQPALSSAASASQGETFRAANPPPVMRNTSQEPLIPAGYGTLKQDEFTMSFRSGPLLIKVTPLTENVIRTAAPDTYNRLHALANSRREEALNAGGPSATELFLVSFFSYQPDVTFTPENLQLVNQGRQLRPVTVIPISSGWSRQRMQQQETQSALYVFESPIDYQQTITAAYGMDQNNAWSGIIPRLQVERSRILARSTR